MTPERWKQIEQLYHSALERNAEERAAYLLQACGGDDALHRDGFREGTLDDGIVDNDASEVEADQGDYWRGIRHHTRLRGSAPEPGSAPGSVSHRGRWAPW